MSTPALVGGVVLVAAVVVAVLIVLLRPHAWEAGDAASAGAADSLLAAEASGAGTTGTGASSVGASGGPESGAGVGGGAADPSARVFVHVVGEVENPGVYELPGDARVEAALTAAGGATKDAVLSAVNLARTVVDGEQIVVPDQEGAEQGAAAAHPGETGAGSGAGTGAGASASAGGPVDLNTADATQLETLPRVGPALAQRILDWRAANGGFTSVDQLTEVSGIGAKTLEGLRSMVTVR